MLVVMNLYPLRARLPRNFATVEDRLHELSFGNRLRQDHDTARRVNALVEPSTILSPWFHPLPSTSGCRPACTRRGATRSSTPSSTSTCRIRPPRSFPRRRIRPTTRMECAISRRRPCSAAAATGSNSRATSCGPRRESLARGRCAAAARYDAFKELKHVHQDATRRLRRNVRPTTGDRVRLADTDIIIEVEKDFCTYGEEVKFGGGKVIRDGMGQSQSPTKPARSTP